MNKISGLYVLGLEWLFTLLLFVAWTCWWAYDVVRRERDLTHAETSEVDANRLDTLWENLGGEDGAAVGERLAELGSRAVDFLASRLHPASDDPEWIATLIADLDRPDRRIWEAAAAELQGLGRLAEGALKRARLSPEIGEFRRLKLLRSLDSSSERYPETLRRGRALEVLRRTGHPQARLSLEVLARGAPEAPFTEEAKAALKGMS